MSYKAGSRHDSDTGLDRGDRRFTPIAACGCTLYFAPDISPPDRGDIVVCPKHGTTRIRKARYMWRARCLSCPMDYKSVHMGEAETALTRHHDKRPEHGMRLYRGDAVVAVIEPYTTPEQARVYESLHENFRNRLRRIGSSA